MPRPAKYKPGTRANLLISLDRPLKARILAAARKAQGTVSDWIARACEEKLTRDKGGR